MSAQENSLPEISPQTILKGPFGDYLFPPFLDIKKYANLLQQTRKPPTLDFFLDSFLENQNYTLPNFNKHVQQSIEDQIQWILSLSPSPSDNTHLFHSNLFKQIRNNIKSSKLSEISLPLNPHKMVQEKRKRRRNSLFNTF